MIVGIGLDIVELDRIKRSWERFGLRFAKKILHPEELSALPENPATYLASRFAAKEAAAKALGTGFTGNIWMQDIYVKKNSSGRPEIVFTKGALERQRSMGAGRSQLSITHSRDNAAAVVILETLP